MVGVQFTRRQRAFMVLRFAETHSAVQVQQEFRRRFGRAPPTPVTIRNNFKKYRDEGTSRNLCKQISFYILAELEKRFSLGAPNSKEGIACNRPMTTIRCGEMSECLIRLVEIHWLSSLLFVTFIPFVLPIHDY